MMNYNPRMILSLRVCTEVFLKCSFRFKHHFSQAFKRSYCGCRANEFGIFESHAFSYHIIKKEAPFAVGLFVGEMLEKPDFLSASLCKGELEADLIESVLQTKSEITTPLAFQMGLEKKAKKQIKKWFYPRAKMKGF